MADTVKMTRKEKIAAGIPKEPKRKKAMANRIKDEKADQVQVTLRNYRSSARKMRMVADLIRKMEVFDAMNTLKLSPRAAAPAMRKLLRAAIASLEEKFEDQRVDINTHYVKEVTVDGARMLKRLRPAPQGRAHIIRKRYCHVTLVIDEIPQIEE